MPCAMSPMIVAISMGFPAIKDIKDYFLGVSIVVAGNSVSVISEFGEHNFQLLEVLIDAGELGSTAI